MATRTRAAGRCEECGRAFAVFRSTDGTVTPIGCGDGCPCGSTEFRLLSGTSSGT